MASYENVVGGKLKLKGKALDVKGSGVKKKKKKSKHKHLDDDAVDSSKEDIISEQEMNGNEDIEADDFGGKLNGEGKTASIDHLLTSAEKRYIEQRGKLDVNKMAKEAGKSHRDRIQDFNQYLANLSEHYDIPKVGPG